MPCWRFNHNSGNDFFQSISSLSGSIPQIRYNQEKNWCVGCGMCAALCPKSHFEMCWNDRGEYNPVVVAEANFVLHVWLKAVPEYAVIFCQLLLMSGLANQLTIGLQTAVQSVGKIKLYQSSVGSLLLLNLPLSWFALKLGAEAWFVFIIAIFVEIIAVISRMFFLKKLAGLSIYEYLQKVMLPVLICTSVVVIAIRITRNAFQAGWPELFGVVGVSSLAFCVTIYIFGMNKKERRHVTSLLYSISQTVRAIISA